MARALGWTRTTNTLLLLVAFKGALSAAPVWAVDVPVHGRALSLRVAKVHPARRLARFTLADDAIAAPFPDPREGSRLILSGGIGSGQCRVDVALDPSKWVPLSADGASDGYRYRDSAGTVAGIRRLVLKPGKISMLAGLSAWPCSLSGADRASGRSRWRPDVNLSVCGYRESVQRDLRPDAGADLLPVGSRRGAARLEL